MKTIDNLPKVIFTTAYIDYALEGYELDVVDYLVKPISFERFLKAINKYFAVANPVTRKANITERETLREKDFIFVRSEPKNHKILFSEILYIESVKDYIKIHTKNKRLIVKNTLTSFEQELPPGDFVRVHRSYLVNLNFITAYTAHDIEIDSIEIAIGISYKQIVFERLK